MIEVQIQMAERSEKTDKGRLVDRWRTPVSMKIARAEAVKHADDGNTHRAVLVRSLRPGEVFLYPKRESHCSLCFC